VLALHLVARHRRDSGRLDDCIRGGARWLIGTQNADGGWGDTTRSRSNISTTAIVWAALSSVVPDGRSSRATMDAAERWLRGAAGDIDAAALRAAIVRRYGKDRTFSVPILTVLALAGKLEREPESAWRSIPQLPFELAALPHGWFQYLQLPVVSYALPALIAIGQVRHHRAPSRNPFARLLRDGVRERTLRLLREMQPESGGYLEATPLTSFVVMSLAAAGRAENPVTCAGVRFLIESMRRDGSWPIDTNLSTWVTTLSIRALMGSGVLSGGHPTPIERAAMREWLLRQQSTRAHPFTHAAPGAWAWTPLSGGVPDADDTSGALIALRLLGEPDATTTAAATAGVRWLLRLQNRDGGIPTFCRGWGALPFDRSTPEITAHAMHAWAAWATHFDAGLRDAIGGAARRAVRYLARVQRPDGSWVPLWFGNEKTEREENPVYGTARVLAALAPPVTAETDLVAECRRRAVRWILDAQNDDGGWGGNRGIASSIEETGAVLSSLGRLENAAAAAAVKRGATWLLRATEADRLDAAPIGLYFARLWYYEALYPLIFSIAGLRAADRRSAGSPPFN
jgi:squalene-hopene/tetraprenyl-beta-curcumene cyclase